MGMLDFLCMFEHVVMSSVLLHEQQPTVSFLHVPAPLSPTTTCFIRNWTSKIGAVTGSEKCSRPIDIILQALQADITMRLGVLFIPSDCSNYMSRICNDFS